MSKVRHLLGISGGKDSAALAVYVKDNYPDSGLLKDLESTYNKTQNTLTELKENKDEI